MSSPTATDPQGLDRALAGMPARLARRFTVPPWVFTGLFVLAVLYTLYFARGFLLPVVLAGFLVILLRPAVHALQRFKVPPALGAGVLLIGLLAGLGLAVYELSVPAAEWVTRTPEIIEQLEEDIVHLKKPVARVSEATERIGRFTKVESEGPRVVALAEPGIGEALVTVTAEVVAGFVVMVVLTWFLLASGDLFLRKAVRLARGFGAKRRLVEVARHLEHDVSRYLLTITFINSALGVVVGTALWLLGMPTPALWGAMAAVLNFIPYLGAIVMVTIVTVVGLLSFESTGYALLVSAIYFGLTATEGYLVTPWLVGHRLSLNPVVIFAGLIFWGWIWGVAGALLAVPILMVIKVACDRTRGLEPVGELLGR